MEKVSFGKMNLVQLKEECRRRGAKISGRKRDLVEMLESYVKNSNFGREETLQPEFQMNIPDILYCDLNTDLVLPDIFTMPYLESCHASLTHIAKSMYHERYVVYLRQGVANNLIYLRAQVMSQMKKIHYLVDIMVDMDGVILEAQCECAAGMGPHSHCKHVQTIIYGISIYKNDGFLCAQTCREKLQGFLCGEKAHRVTHKSQSLSLPINKKLVYDPRQYIQPKESYEAHFRNVWMAAKDAPQRPVFQLFEPANMLALVKDHNYCCLQMEENFLQSIGLKEMSDTSILILEKKTRGQSANKLWVEERLKRIQSSNFGRICKATEKTNLNNLAKVLMVKRDISSPALRHGQKYEAVALKEFEQFSGLKVNKCGLFVSKQFPFLASSPDGVITVANGLKHVVEAKCPYVTFFMTVILNQFY